MTSPAVTDAHPPRLKEHAFPLSFLVFLLVIAVFIGARLWRLTTSCLWFDEIFGVQAARLDWKPMLQFVAADLIHPPLFYVLLKIWTAIGGESILWLRLFPVLLSVGAIVPIVLLCRALKLSHWQTNIALALLAVNGYLIKYAQEVRMYSLLFLLGCTSLWLFVKFIESADLKRVWLALSMVNLLLVYSHYYGWILVAVELLLLLLWWRERVLKFLVTMLALILSYLPWFYLITISREPGRGLAQNIGWVARPGLSDVAQFFALLNTPFFFRQSSAAGSLNDIWNICLSLVLVGVPLAFLIRQTLKKQNPDERMIWMLSGFLLMPIALVLVLSWVLPHSAWGTRHLIIVAGPYSILAAIALTRLRISWLKTVCLVLIGCWVLLNGAVILVRRPLYPTWCTWEPLAKEVVRAETNPTSSVHVYAFEDLVAYHFWFAFADPKLQIDSQRFRVHVVKGVPGLREDPAYFLPRRFYEIETQDGAAFNGDSIWLAFRDSQWNPARPPLNLIAAQGFETGRIFELQAQGQRSFVVELRRKGQTQ